MTIVRYFIRSAGALLLAAAFVLFLTNLATGEVAQPRDPVLGLSLRVLFWGSGLVFLGVAALCLFGRWEFTQLMLLAWVSVNLLAYVVGLYWMGTESPAFLFGSVSDAFGLSPRVAMSFAGVLLVYVLFGSSVLLVWLWLGARAGKWAVFPDQFAKTHCSSCGGHIQFAMRDAGKKVSCPHCQAGVTLHKPGNLRISCYFCKEHIEFPSHALGTKMPCPHCKMDITLKEPA